MRTVTLLTLLGSLAAGCGDDTRPCQIGDPQPSLDSIVCREEFEQQAARPLDAALPGAWTIKTMIDRARDEQIHFLDTEAYPLHRAFAEDHLGWPPNQDFFNQYTFPDRRFLLGSVTWYQGPDLYVYELAPYDTADVDMITRSMDLLDGAMWIDLAFHPTSEEQRARAAELPERIRVVTTEELYEGIDYQPLNLGETVAQLRVLDAAQLDTVYVSPRELVVLDQVPNDISVVAGVITEEFQTPLSHINVLSQQRGTPNMALRDARTALAGFEGRWVRLTVGAFEWAAAEVTQAEADAWWEANRPDPVVISQPDYSATDLRDVDDLGLADIPAFGGKAAHFGELRDIGDPVVVRDGFAIPVYYYDQFLQQNGFDAEIDAMLADPGFQGDGVVRRARLQQLVNDMLLAPVDAGFLAALEAKLQAEFPSTRMRFRSSTNAEDLQGFSGAGLYQSASGQVGNPVDPVDLAVKIVWSSLWSFRAFEERAYRSIVHRDAAMAVLVHPGYGDSETANGVAITANIFDPAAGGEDGFYINVQIGEISVVQPPGSGIVADQLMYYFSHNGQPATYYTRSNQIAEGTTVLTRRELYELGLQLQAIRTHFGSGSAPIYQPPAGYSWLPMDVEFKRMGTGDSSTIEIKQARPYPGRGN